MDNYFRPFSSAVTFWVFAFVELALTILNLKKFCPNNLPERSKFTHAQLKAVLTSFKVLYKVINSVMQLKSPLKNYAFFWLWQMA